jgi:hypothetical protein
MEWKEGARAILKRVDLQVIISATPWPEIFLLKYCNEFFTTFMALSSVMVNTGALNPSQSSW